MQPHKGCQTKSAWIGVLIFTMHQSHLPEVSAYCALCASCHSESCGRMGMLIHASKVYVQCGHSEGDSSVVTCVVVFGCVQCHILGILGMQIKMSRQCHGTQAKMAWQRTRSTPVPTLRILIHTPGLCAPTVALSASQKYVHASAGVSV